MENQVNQQGTVTLNLTDYNLLRDFKTNVEKGLIPILRCRYNSYEFYTQNEAIIKCNKLYEEEIKKIKSDNEFALHEIKESVKIGQDMQKNIHKDEIKQIKKMSILQFILFRRERQL